MLNGPSAPIVRFLVFIAVLVALVAVAIAPAVAQAEPQRAKKIVIIGFDGADPRLVDQYMSEGLLPNLQRMKERYSYAPILPPNPPQTPVSWAAFSTGNLPGKTEIFDFLQREDGGYSPDFALATREKIQFALGEKTGLVAAAVLGVLAALLVLLVAKLARARFVVAALLAVVTLAGITFGLAGPIGRLLPVEVPHATNNRKTTPFWTQLANAGWKVGVVRVPVTFPAEELPEHSAMISGLGVPDMRGRVGTPSLWTTDPAYTSTDNQFSLEITKLPARRGLVETRIVGPTNYPFHVYVLDRAEAQWREEGIARAEIRERRKQLAKQLEESGQPQQINIKLMLDIKDDRVDWTLQDGTTGSLADGEWSDFVVLDFPLNFLVDGLKPLRGMVRFKVIKLDPEVQIYMSPINFHPTSRPVPYTWPPDLAEKLADDIGLFKTQGWAIDTWSYPTNRLGGVDLFLEDMEFTVEGYRKLLHRMLEEDFDLYTQIFYFTDRAGHMLWYNIDEGHPLYEPENAHRFEKAMRDVYQKMDTIVGEVWEKLDEDTLFIVLSDHGFSSFRRQINYNTWLWQQGLLSLKGRSQSKTLEQLFDKDVQAVDVFSGIDWSRTKAWAMGLGSIYINVVGREPQGIVMPGEEYDAVVKQIKEGLEGLIDPETGERPIFRVYHRDEIYTHYDPGKVPDLRAANILNYRVSWQDTLGGLSTQVFENNDRVWSGDHCSLEPSVLQGILFVNRKLDTAEPRIIDMGPSILNEVGLAPVEPMDGTPVWQPGVKR